ncbi:protein of unknown function [Candidatus Nitrotoga arctica]|uniref:Uncharacterized protein n=1 Tax=Candidatus Nitrotoga arctica TaxID=453162 RepID=A0ABM8Z0S3_9PROT|nr:protein of unknown function [Candidatus Nitrotoga arctica]
MLELEVAVNEFIVHTTKDIKPFIWTVKVFDISQKQKVIRADSCIKL